MGIGKFKGGILTLSKSEIAMGSQNPHRGGPDGGKKKKKGKKGGW